MQIRPKNYSLHFQSVEIHKHCLYWKIFSTDIYRNFFSTVWCFFSYIYWSVDCISWVSKFDNFFLTCTEGEARFLFESFNIVLYGKFIYNSLIPFPFFIWSVNCSRYFFSHFASQEIVSIDSLKHRTYLGDVQ